MIKFYSFEAVFPNTYQAEQDVVRYEDKKTLYVIIGYKYGGIHEYTHSENIRD